MKKFNKINVSKIFNRSGIYIFYNKYKKIIYFGRSKILKHRLQSYYQKDCFREHRTKKLLRKRIKYFSVKYMPKSKAKKLELIKKNGNKFNYR